MAGNIQQYDEWQATHLGIQDLSALLATWATGYLPNMDEPTS